jgi:Protein of unknown function (DUF2934)
MAKRPTPRSKATDPAAPAQPKPKRARSGPPPSESTAADTPAAEPTVDDIRRRAYQRYLERGGNHGQHFDDWLEAEKELRIKK